jgi:V-type H+-transporting ATPase subunit a
VNYRNFGRKLDIYANFLPSVLFLCSIFGYLVLCILYKWSVNWSLRGTPPPGLLNMLIYMFLSPGKIDIPLYPGQRFVQNVLLLVALVCVPWMLLLKPLYLRWDAKRNIARGYAGIPQTRESEEQTPTRERFSIGVEDDEEMLVMEMQVLTEETHAGFDFSEVMIHQAIHTIEFCLNCISHTASYLRLWGPPATGNS